MPIGTCMQVVVKHASVTGAHCSAERYHYAVAQKTVRNKAAVLCSTAMQLVV